MMAAESIDLFSADPPWLQRPGSVIEHDFASYHKANPSVYQFLEEAALSWKASNPRRIGIAQLAERARYWKALTVSQNAPGRPFVPFKINNNHRALYALLLIYRHPSLATVIEVRRRKEPGAKVE